MQQLFYGLAQSLERLPCRNNSSDQYVDRLVRELEATQLTPNPSPPKTEVPSQSWARIFEEVRHRKHNPALAALYELEPLHNWIRASEFYPEPRHCHFSGNVWGSLIAGQQDALFDAQERYIALLILIDTDTTYPLHAHRIEELYYVLSGHAQWSHDGRNWETVPPGSIFHNDSYQPHTMRTSDEPLMAMGLYLPPFGWEGGLLESETTQ